MKPIRSRDNPEVRRLRALAHDARERRKQGASVLDGPHLLAAALDAGWVPELLAVSESGRAKTEIAALLERQLVLNPYTRCLELPDSLFRSVSPTDSPAGILALVCLPPPGPPPDPSCDWLLLDRIQDAGNLGTLLRTAAAAGIREVLLGTGCTQAYSPRTLRAGMGAQFLLRIHESVDLLAQLEGYSGQVLATALGPESVPIFSATLRPPLAWLFGAEGQGLTPALLARAEQRVIIPMTPGVESLNVGAAAAVCLFEVVRRRSAPGAFPAL